MAASVRRRAGAEGIVDESAAASTSARERAWRRAQAISGLVFLAFVLLHLVNTMLAGVSVAAYDAFQRVLRPVYQHPAVELTLVMAPLLVHVAAAVRRIWIDGVRGRGGSLRARLHRVTGYFLLLVIFGHIAAVRGPSFFLDVFPESGGVSFSLWLMPVTFHVYYTLLLASATFHGINGAVLATARLRVHVPGALRGGPGFWVPVGSLTGLGVLGLLGLGGWLYDLPDPTGNSFARMLQDFGIYELLGRKTP